MELSNLSSNWKKLQKQLQKDQHSTNGTTGPNSLKRKKSADHDQKPQSVNGAVNKRRRHETAKNKAVNRRPTMGSYLSRATAVDTTATVNGSKASSSPTTPETSLDSDDPASILLNSPSEPFVPNLGFYSAASSGKHKFIAIDCEMVGIGPPPHSDSQLARVSATNYHGEVLYDSYVLPVLPVADYRTFVSGITEEHLAPDSARPFKEVQADIGGLLNGRILVGHAIKNDLEALILNHPKRDIRDTSRYLPYRAISGGRTPGLKKLAKQFLGVTIQEGEHSSVIDARAAMALFRREKAGFEQDVIRRFGVAKQAPPVQEVDEGLEEARREKARIKNRKKKKKKK